MMQFDQRAEQYGQHAQVQRAMADWLAEWLPAVANPSGMAMEYGAGEGMFTRCAWPHFQDVLAVDLAPRMVAAGRERAPEADWRQGDAWLGDGLGPDVDAVLSSSLLQWCPNPKAVFQRWREVLRPGAKMLHGFYVDPTLSELQALQGESLLAWRPAQAWLDALEQTGWKVVRGEAETRTVNYRSALELLRSLHGVGAVRRGSVRGSRLRRLIREYDRRFATDDGVHASWTFCRIQAKAAPVPLGKE